ncbi:MAG: sulfatase-like hydrolase/transferase [Bdellovibrionaceae bacterium]|nr:sulfatase-like hydrolase/transferase [Pseudobdellovibrionaceae bacterium]
MIKFVFCVISLSISAFSLTSCTWTEPAQPSILVIAVEELGFGAITCAGDNERHSGFEILCHEAVRFTHAYTPSTLSVPALASLMTGRYPHEHLVRDNGSAYLSARLATVAEAAVEKGHRTAYFGGGPPVWRNSGLNQGFEVFDDNVLPAAPYYRPAGELTRLFLEWREMEVARRPYLAVLHFADPQFPDAATVTDLGDIRPSSYRSQIEEVDETLGALFRRLRDQKLWDTTTIVVAGLAGHVAEPRIGESREVNVNSEKTRVALFIKPARRQREAPLNWKIDTNVSLVDAGPTLFELLAKPYQASFPRAESVVAQLENPDASLPMERIVMTESSWASWRGFSGRRFALRQGPLLYLHDGSGRLFNTLTDSLETSPLPPSELRYWDMRAPFDAMVGELGLLPWLKLPPNLTTRLDLGRELWRPKVKSTGDEFARLRILAKASPNDFQLQGWRAIFALRESRWSELKDASAKTLNGVWFFVAAANLNETVSVPEDACVKLFSQLGQRKAPTLRECSNREILELFFWVDESQSPARRQAAGERFVRLYMESATQQRISELNHSLGLTWDVPASRPEGPGLADLILALPEMKKYRLTLDRRLSGKNQ